MQNTFPSHITFHRIQILFWLLIGSFNYVIWINYEEGPEAIELVVEYGLGLLLSYGLNFLYFFMNDKKLIFQLFLSALVALPVAIFWRILVNYAHFAYFSADTYELKPELSLHNAPASYLLLLAWSVGFWLVN